MMYIASDWYWIVGGDETKAYASAYGDYVPVSDADYAAWLALDNLPSRIGTAAELGEVLALARVTPPPTDAAVLAGYQDAVAAEITKAADAQLMLYTLNVARKAGGEAPIAAGEFQTFVRDQVLKP